jgi:hypothetical protein
MTNWRDGASEEVQDDFDRLAEVTIAAARSFLDRNGEFIPFPMAVKSDGEVALIGLEQPVTPEVPVPEDVIHGIVELFRQRKGSIRALAIGADVQVPAQATDAIEVRLEHQDGACITVLVPYRLDPLDDSYTYDEVIVEDGTPAIWV